MKAGIWSRRRASSVMHMLRSAARAWAIALRLPVARSRSPTQQQRCKPTDAASSSGTHLPSPLAPERRPAIMPLNLKFKTVQGKQFELGFEEDTKVGRLRSQQAPGPPGSRPGVGDALWSGARPPSPPHWAVVDPAATRRRRPLASAPASRRWPM